MAKELAFVLINPYTVSKSRTGGVIARYISRTGLDLVAARMFTPHAALANAYADQIRGDVEVEPTIRPLLADYVAREYGPDPATGRSRRVMMLLFEGENAIELVKDVTGPIRPTNSGETVRDTYGDYILDAAGAVKYLEPAVFIGPTLHAAGEALKLWAKYSAECGGMVDSAGDVAQGAASEEALVILKPDNFRLSVRSDHKILQRIGSGMQNNTASAFYKTGGSGYRVFIAELYLTGDGIYYRLLHLKEVGSNREHCPFEPVSLVTVFCIRLLCPFFVGFA